MDETGCPIGGNGGPHSGDYAGVMVPSTAVLGTGGLTLLPGAKIRLGSASNLANGAQIGMTSNSAANAVLALAYDAVPNLTSASSGVIGIDVTNTTISNEAGLGNGGMFLGTVMGGSLIAPTLAPERKPLPPRRRRSQHRVWRRQRHLHPDREFRPGRLQFHFEQAAGREYRPGRAGRSAAASA